MRPLCSSGKLRCTCDELLNLDSTNELPDRQSNYRPHEEGILVHQEQVHHVTTGALLGVRSNRCNGPKARK